MKSAKGHQLQRGNSFNVGYRFSSRTTTIQRSATCHPESSSKDGRFSAFTPSIVVRLGGLFTLRFNFAGVITDRCLPCLARW